MLRGLPPVMLIRAEYEILWDEISALGRKIVGAGGEVCMFVELRTSRDFNSLNRMSIKKPLIVEARPHATITYLPHCPLYVTMSAGGIPVQVMHTWVIR